MSPVLPRTSSRALAVLCGGALAAASALVGTACSGGIGGGKSSNAQSACTLIVRLGQSAAELEGVDQSDPEAFDQALESAVVEFGDTIDSLEKVTPDSMHDDLARLKAAAQQYRFEDAIEARGALDDYARANCNAKEIAESTSTTGASTTTTAVTGPTGSTETSGSTDTTGSTDSIDGTGTSE